MGVELNALETAKAAADEPKRYRLISLLHPKSGTVVHDGKLTGKASARSKSTSAYCSYGKRWKVIARNAYCCENYCEG